MDAKSILEKAKKYRDWTAENLGAMIRVPGFSCTEKERIAVIRKMCEEAGMEDLFVDGLGSLLGRVGKGPKKLVIDAHIDTVGIGDPTQWKTPPHSGLIADGLVHGRGASDQLGGAASMITAARILKEAHYAGDYSVWFAFTTIEEDCDGLCWKHLIEVEGFKPDFAVSTEPTSCRLYRGHRGRMEIQ
ncbi:MAG: M20/M25/M40 family metallo-hydrolase, partial [Spirochaetaceae bacterium]|nr:M20/M25/M40 family metallo-hydrolase [Spirochaetaceae bacterium]